MCPLLALRSCWRRLGLPSELWQDAITTLPTSLWQHCSLARSLRSICASFEDTHFTPNSRRAALLKTRRLRFLVDTKHQVRIRNATGISADEGKKRASV